MKIKELPYMVKLFKNYQAKDEYEKFTDANDFFFNNCNLENDCILLGNKKYEEKGFYSEAIIFICKNVIYQVFFYHKKINDIYWYPATEYNIEKFKNIIAGKIEHFYSNDFIKEEEN